MSDTFATAPIDKGPPDPMNWLRRHGQRAPAGHWDELRDQSSSMPEPVGEPASLWGHFLDRLGPGGLTSLNQRMASLRRQVHDNGITYNVHTQGDSPQRPWSLDLFPMLIGAEAWRQIERGVRQRMRLLEHIMADAYGPRNLLARGLLPAALVHGHPGYLYPMHGVAPVGGHYLSLAAFDLARGPDGLWWLLSQRTQAPSGLGYLLENRLIVSRLFPEAFESLPVQRLAATYLALVEGLKARCPGTDGEAPHIALLTPGPFNETYFEHAYLARYLGLSLVQADDLVVRSDRLYLKTLQGLQRVHGLLKRVDDSWLDPLELRADSALGVPGLLQAVRSGQLLVANTPGSGFLESNALLGFMPALAQDLLGESLVLPAIPSWWCGEAAALPEALRQLSNGVVKPTYPHDGQGRGFEPQLMHQLPPRERQDWAERIEEEPEAHTVQSWLPLSHLPVWDDHAGLAEALQTRPVILRVFAVIDASGQAQVLPGGLARLGTREGIASMQRGGSSADVWVQAPSRDAVSPVSLLGRNASLAPHQRPVTSRAAENLFWMGRYTERSENTLRLSRVILDVLGSEDQGSQRLLGWLSRMAQSHGLVPSEVSNARPSIRVFERALVAGLWETTQTTGVGFNLRALMRAAMPVRERLSLDHWQMLQDTEAGFFKGPESGRERPPGQIPPTPVARECLLQTSQRLAAVTGFQTDRMSRDDGWRLLSIGRHIERLDFLAGALAMALEARLLTEQAGFDAVLGVFDSTISFHAQYQQSRTPQALVELLVTSADNPRSLAWVALTLRSRLQRIAHLADGASAALAGAMPASPGDPLLLWPAESAWPPALMDLLAIYRSTARSTADGLTGLFFTHSGPAAHSVRL